MICALLVDPDDAPDFPGGTAEVLGRPLAAYPLLAAKGARYVRRLFVSSASQTVARVAAQLGAVNLTPPQAAGEERLSDEALIRHGYRQVADDLKTENIPLELLVILFANTGAVSSALIDEGVQAMLDDAALDSAATVSRYDRWNPRRAMREGPDGLLAPYAACVEDAGAPWFPDWGAVVARPRVLDALTPDSPPLAYLGKRVRPLEQLGGGPIDRQWQVPKLEYWLKKQGVRGTEAPQPIPKLQPAPKTDRR
ncbi:MAG: hypothetical protein KGM24_14160 [Elusimicrobia bacterium]|nr:hypothetical protein [Elusimicrobiota bacterium]